MELVEITEALGRYFDTDEGLLVVHAPDDEGIDIEDGDVILAISDRTPNSPEHAIRILSSFEAGETIEFSLMRDGRRRTVEYVVPEPDAMSFELERVAP
jgi:S1-C subfamily serine protease